MSPCGLSIGSKEQECGRLEQADKAAIATPMKSGHGGPAKIAPHSHPGYETDAERNEVQGGFAMRPHERRFKDHRQRVLWAASALCLTAIVGTVGAGIDRAESSF